jgi:hypothetical protein
MRKSLRAWTVAAATAVVAGAAYAAITLGPPGTVGGAGPTSAAQFNTFLNLNLEAVYTGTTKDFIVAVHEGRDTVGPFATIEFVPATNHPAPVLAYLATLPFQPSGSPPVPGAVQITYRPTNDPVNPGWLAPPAPFTPTAAAAQLEAAITATHQFAEAVRQCIRFQEDIAAGVVVIPTPLVERDITPASPPFGDFYKYMIATRAR